jgi:hypothetical protein
MALLPFSLSAFGSENATAAYIDWSKGRANPVSRLKTLTG